MTTLLPAAISRYFTGKVIDDSPRLLEESYRLRYQVYCLERHFLPAENYPQELEVDSFDQYSIHVAVLNTDEEVIATARLVQTSVAGLPLLEHCSFFDGAPAPHDGMRAVEVSRLAVSRKYNRRAGDGFYGLQGAPDRSGTGERREGGAVVLALYKALYQASKRLGITHWFVATERSLQRLVARYAFPFKLAGPETDYYGRVAPYVMDLAEFDQVILAGQIPLLGEFLQGLEPEFCPCQDDACVSGRFTQ